MPAPRAAGAVLFALAVGSLAPAQPPTAEQQAEQLLTAGRKAYNDGNPQFAVEKLREYVQKYGGHKDAQAGRLALGLAYLDAPDRDLPKAIESLTPPASDANFPDRGLALYYLGTAHRGTGLKEIEQAIGKPNEMPQRVQATIPRFTEAGKLFVMAREQFEKKNEPEWAARSRCDAAEMDLRCNRTKEARAHVEPFAKDAALAKSAFRQLGLYYHGTACFLLNDIPAAGKSLGQVAPFAQPFGPHARYLMGRVHMTQGESAEAAAAFDAVLAEADKQKKAAVELLKQPDRFKSDPWEKARLTGLTQGQPPDYVSGAAFYGACLNYEAGKFGEALPKFQAFAKEYATSPLKDDAALRVGFCLVQTKSFEEAAKVLQPLTGVQRIADQAFYWLGKAQAGAAANAEKPEQMKQGLGAAVNSLRTAADRAGQLAGNDPDAKARRGEIMLELADTQLLAKQPRDAAGTYEAVFNEKTLPARQEEILQRMIAAFSLAGELPASESRIAAFKQQFPQSTLMPLVMFRGAENAFTRAADFKKQNNPEAKKAFADAAAKYQEVVAKFPEFDRVGRAKFGMALCHVAVEDWEKAAATMESIAATDRVGDLATVPYMLADCLIRTAPAKAEDALQDNILREKLTNAANLLDGFVASNPKAAETPDALLKLGLCYKRLGVQLAPGNERNEALNKSRGTYERLAKDFPQSVLVGSATLERAKVVALQGDRGGATNALRAFANDPLAKSPVAPLASVALATLLREQNQFPQAIEVMASARQKFEGQLNGDAERREWVPLLRYHHGVALFEGGKVREARDAFEQAIQAAGGKPIAAEAALKSCQCSAVEAKAKIAATEKEREKPNLTAPQKSDIENRVKQAKGELAGVGRSFERRADEFKNAMPTAEARARLLYDAAWTFRTAGEDPTAAYTKLIAEFPDLSLAVEGRLELAELAADKGKPDDAIKMLKEALDKETTDKPAPGETLERIRIRLGGALFDKKDYGAAQGQFDAVAANEKSPHRGQALYRSAECLLATGKADEAAKKLVIFRDNGAFHNIAGVSDRALLRLGHALSQSKQWEPARQSFDTLVQRYGGNSPWAVDARYGVAWALQNMGRYDEAVNVYAQVAQGTTDDRAGRAHLQIGMCRAAQQKWADAGKAFATVYYTFDTPELKFASLVEHARVLVEEKKTDEAVKLLERVVKDAPKDGEWAKAAAERLAKLKK
jgi:tetratricopeptide (TPR) repeat protein